MKATILLLMSLLLIADASGGLIGSKGKEVLEKLGKPMLWPVKDDETRSIQRGLEYNVDALRYVHKASGYEIEVWYRNNRARSFFFKKLNGADITDKDVERLLTACNEGVEEAKQGVDVNPMPKKDRAPRHVLHVADKFFVSEYRLRNQLGEGRRIRFEPFDAVSDGSFLCSSRSIGHFNLVTDRAKLITATEYLFPTGTFSYTTVLSRSRTIPQYADTKNKAVAIILGKDPLYDSD